MKRSSSYAPIPEETRLEKLSEDDIDTVDFDDNNEKRCFTRKRCFYLLCLVIAGIVGLIAWMAITGLLKRTKDDNETPDSPKFGRSLRSEFCLEPDYINLNHGAYGATPSSVMQSRQKWLQHVESNPDRWVARELDQQIAKARQAVADYVKANSSDIVFIPNASAAVNTVLRSIHPSNESRSTIIYYDTAYGMVKNVLAYLNSLPTCSQQLHQITLPYPPPSPDDIVAQFSKELDQHEEIYLAVLDHISSYPPILMPIKEMINECHKRNITVLVDGAHALGQIPLDLTALQADFYLANGHKWLYSPKGSAILYVDPKHQSSILPYVISSFSTDLQTNFKWVGTTDYTAYVTMEDAIDYRAKRGEQDIIDYNIQLSRQGIELVASKWNTKIFAHDQPQLTNISMAAVQLPVQPPPSNLGWTFYDAYNARAVVFQYQDIWWARFSAQIYVDLSDYEFYADNMLTFLGISNLNRSLI